MYFYYRKNVEEQFKTMEEMGVEMPKYYKPGRKYNIFRRGGGGYLSNISVNNVFAGYIPFLTTRNIFFLA